MARSKSADEVFCQSCGSAIKKKTETCPECGVRNVEYEPPAGSQQQATTGGSGTSVHDPSQYTTTVADNWWLGVAGATVAIVLGFVVSTVSEPLASVLFLGIFVMPVAMYFDMQYVRANSQWNPSTVLWVVGSLLLGALVIPGVVYLYRRHETLGVPNRNSLDELAS